MLDTVHVLCWSGSPEVAKSFILSRYPSCQLVFLNQREFREHGWRGQLRILRGLRGQVLVYFFSSPSDNRMPQVLAWSGLVHGCQETVVATGTGEWKSYRRVDWPRMVPRLGLSAACDFFVLLFTSVLLRVLTLRRVPVTDNTAAVVDLAYVFPFPLDQSEVGGAMTHVTGFLKGLARVGGACDIYSARQIPADDFPSTVVSRIRQFYIFHELVTLSFNWGFALRISRLLRRRRPRAIYQRHRRFAIAGALLSRWLRVPLILEFNGSEIWVSRHWDPARFPRLLALCEEFNLASASTIVVVSEVLRDDLVSRGVSSDRIIVNPNGVDPGRFHPNCGGVEVRAALGFTQDDIVAAFVGTFSYWHGVEVLQQAILNMMDAAEHDAVLNRLKFMLIGRGPLFEDMRNALAAHPHNANRIVLPGNVAHDLVPSYLDAADILLSPHVPMPDGRRFFGSPTKLFEYMAAGKGIVASRLDQLATVLKDRSSALLVTPGDVHELVLATRQLAADACLRERLGRCARETVIANYTWAQNATRVLGPLRTVSSLEQSSIPTEVTPIGVPAHRQHTGS